MRITKQKVAVRRLRSGGVGCVLGRLVAALSGRQSRGDIFFGTGSRTAGAGLRAGGKRAPEMIIYISEAGVAIGNQQCGRGRADRLGGRQVRCRSGQGDGRRVGRSSNGGRRVTVTVGGGCFERRAGSMLIAGMAGRRGCGPHSPAGSLVFAADDGSEGTFQAAFATGGTRVGAVAFDFAALTDGTRRGVVVSFLRCSIHGDTWTSILRGSRRHARAAGGAGSGAERDGAGRCWGRSREAVDGRPDQEQRQSRPIHQS